MTDGGEVTLARFGFSQEDQDEIVRRIAAGEDGGTPYPEDRVRAELRAFLAEIAAREKRRRNADAGTADQERPGPEGMQHAGLHDAP